MHIENYIGLICGLVFGVIALWERVEGEDEWAISFWIISIVFIICSLTFQFNRLS